MPVHHIEVLGKEHLLEPLPFRRVESFTAILHNVKEELIPIESFDDRFMDTTCTVKSADCYMTNFPKGVV